MKTLTYTILVLLLLSVIACGESRSERTWRILNGWSAEQHVGGIMFIGDSITEYWPAKYMPEGSFNRGIAGDTSGEVLRRTWLTIEETPDEMYLMVGINSLYLGVPPENVISDIDQIINEVQAGVSGVSIHIFSILPASTVALEPVLFTNLGIEEMIFNNHPEVVYIDLFDLFYDGHIINMADGVHPSPDGYQLIYGRLFN